MAMATRHGSGRARRCRRPEARGRRRTRASAGVFSQRVTFYHISEFVSVQKLILKKSLKGELSIPVFAKKTLLFLFTWLRSSRALWVGVVSLFSVKRLAPRTPLTMLARRGSEDLTKKTLLLVQPDFLSRQHCNGGAGGQPLCRQEGDDACSERPRRTQPCEKKKVAFFLQTPDLREKTFGRRKLNRDEF